MSLEICKYCGEYKHDCQCDASRAIYHLERENNQLRADLKPECVWKRWDSGQYKTACNNVFEFTHDGIEENSFKFCPWCGGKITQPSVQAALKET